MAHPSIEAGYGRIGDLARAEFEGLMADYRYSIQYKKGKIVARTQYEAPESKGITLTVNNWFIIFGDTLGFVPDKDSAIKAQARRTRRRLSLI